MDGKRQKSIPARIRTAFAEELKSLQSTAADIRGALSLQRHCLEGLLRGERVWNLSTWRAQCLDHPLQADLTRRLIWHFKGEQRQAVGIWADGRLVDIQDRPLKGLTEECAVRLWHPLGFNPETVQRWRRWLEEHGVTQPFKQAHREIYVLTDAELETRTYSNRFAGHILNQYQFNLLCAQTGWKHELQTWYGRPNADIAVLFLPHWGLRAECWLERAGEITHTAENGVCLYLATDQVRFYGLEGVLRPLTEVPALAFSEVMRDVDQFIGVASIGNDPNWQDRGEAVGARNYWREFSFGDLSATALTRRDLLERLLPRLKIAGRCSLTGKFLVVAGDLRTYKIHLGSGNVLMEPNDQYLCLVPDRGSASEKQTEGLLLPFEGDRTLSVILSKAFLLAEDTRIEDDVTMAQIELHQRWSEE
jgi:hypothetical protein